MASTGNPYAFAESDPVNGTDSDGLLPTCDYVPTACGLNEDHQGAAGSVGPFASTSGGAFSTTTAYTIDNTAFPPTPVKPPAPASLPSPPSRSGPTRADEANWATGQINNGNCAYVNVNDSDSLGDDCTVQNVLGANGFYGCTTTSAGGGCFIDWVAINSTLTPQDHVSGSGSWEAAGFDALDGCWEGGVTAGAGGLAAGGIGAPVAAVGGCLFGGGLEGGAELIVHHVIG